MNGLLHLCCSVCGRAFDFVYMPADGKFGVKWMECRNEYCANKGKRYEPSTIELKAVPHG